MGRTLPASATREQLYAKPGQPSTMELKQPFSLGSLSSVAICVVTQGIGIWSLTSLVALVGGAGEAWRQDFRSLPPVNFTVVTAMLDIGRGEWQSEFARPYSHYLSFLEPVMKLHVNIVAFADSAAASTIRHLRRRHHLDHVTHVVETRLEDLPYFNLRERFEKIMKSDNYSKGNPQSFMRHPEANVPEYDILMLSKTHFVMEAVTLDPFNSSYFIWLDGGYAHGQAEFFPGDGFWHPLNLFRHSDKVTVVELGRGWVEQAKDFRSELHTIRGSLIIGGFFGGGKEALRRLYRLEREVVEGWLGRGVVDDDQSCRVTAYFKDPSLFCLVHGDWWDVFRLFNHTVTVA